MARVERQRVVVVRECLWKLTGEDFHAAAILGQLLYWTLRTKDIDAYLEEEGKRMSQEGDQANVGPTKGWVYKSAEDLAEELLGICSRRTISRRLDVLVDAGWLERRHNPNHQWDRTLQYRPKLSTIDQGLQEIGYSLEDALPQGDWVVVRDYFSIGQTDESIGHSDQCIGQSDQSSGQSDQSSGHPDQAIPETTIENKAEKEESETAAASSPVMCSLHNQPMQLRSKDNDRWFSHRLSDGTWCKGAMGDQPGDNKADSEEARQRYLEWAQ